MDYRQILAYLKGVQSPARKKPEDGQGRLFESFTPVDFLEQSVKKDVPIFISARGFSIHSVLVPGQRLKGSYTADLLNWDVRDCGGGYEVISGSEAIPMRMTVSPPVDVTGELMSYGEPIAHCRVLKLGDVESHYMELSQDFALRHDLHHVQSRGVYCRFGPEGRLDDVVHVVSRKDLRLLTVSRDVLGAHLIETGLALVRLVDFRLRGDMAHGMPEGNADVIMEPPGQGLCLRVTREKAGVWVRGFHLMRLPIQMAVPRRTVAH